MGTSLLPSFSDTAWDVAGQNGAGKTISVRIVGDPRKRARQMSALRCGLPRTFCEKRVVRLRDLDAKYRCAHGIFLHRPSAKSERAIEECAVYRRSILDYLKKFSRKAKSEKRAKDMLAAIGLIEAQENR